MSRARRFLPVFVGLVSLASLSCGGGGDGGTNPGASTPAHVVLAPAGPDTLARGTTLQLSTTVSTANNATLSGYAVTYASSNSSVATVSTTGLVTAGNTTGVTTITASAGTVVSNSVTVVVPTLVGVPQTITQVQAIPDSLVVGTATPVHVKVTDAFGSPVVNTMVTFVVRGGGSPTTPSTATTDANGVATTTWTIGTIILGTDSLMASAGAAHTQIICQPLPGPAVTVMMSVSYTGVSVGDQSFFVVFAQDVYGNLFLPTAAQFVSRNSSILSLTPAVQGAPDFIANFAAQAVGETYVVANVNGLSDSTLVSVFAAGGVLLSAPAPRFDLKTDTTFTTAVQLSTGPSTPGIGSLTAKVTWDPTVLTYVSDAPGNESASVTVNRTNVANGSLTIATANSGALDGQGWLLTLTFTAASTAGRHGALAVTVSDISDTNFMSLLPVTRVLSFPVRTR